MEYLIFFLSLAASFCFSFFGGKTKNEKFNIIKDKLTIIPLVIFFVIRYFAVDRTALRHDLIGFAYKGGETLSAAFGISNVSATFALIAAWLSITAFVLCAVRPFFAIKTFDVLAKYFVPVSAILNIVFIKEIYAINASEAFVTSAFSICLSGEVGCTLGISVYLIVRDIANGYYKDKPTFKTVGYALICLILMLMATMPPYFIQAVFGYMRRPLRVIDLSPTHRVYLYATFATPFFIYFALRNRSEDIRRAAMIYLTVSTMISYSLLYWHGNLLDLADWPFHLCNTAMYVVPICLIFRLKKLFYFTYFINVLGALLAMTMPNYNEAANALSWEIIHFWVNHSCAFFFPLLCVALGLFPKPSIKYFSYSMAFFALYYVVVLVLNAYFTAHGNPQDFFFINSNFIADKLGTWANKLFNLTAHLTIGEYVYEFHPWYQTIYFVSYVLLGVVVWFVYGLFFNVAASHAAIADRMKKIRLDKFALQSQLNGRNVEEPMNVNAGIKLELKNFSKRYGANKDYAVKDASLSVYGGEIFGFLGPNGAGKSTIIKSIVGIQPITEGSIEVCGYDCKLQPVMAKRQIGYVPDHYALYEKLTAREYINYIADIYGVSQKDRDERIEKYVKLFELERAIDSQIRTYSHGMKQKVTIMAALVHEPKIWILDEPLTGLDPNSIFQVKECMREHARKGNIVFFSSHIIEVVEKLCDRITIIKKGHILCTKTIEEVEKECSLEEFYLKNIGAEDIIDKEKELGLIKG